MNGSAYKREKTHHHHHLRKQEKLTNKKNSYRSIEVNVTADGRGRVHRVRENQTRFSISCEAFVLKGE